MDSGRRQLLDPNLIAPLIRRARLEAGLSEEELASHAGTTARTVQRWETAFVPPTRSLREPLVRALANASGESWRALVERLGLSRAEMLAKVPTQAAKAAPPPAPPPPALAPPAPPPPPPDPRAVLDDVVRATAEDLDVSPRKVRAAFAQLTVDLARLGLSYDAARDALLGRGKSARTGDASDD
jgi:DNA-binding XRE family transcriptional regulator